ncbi:hypothetical protein [Mycobacterium kansasii]
MRAKLGLRTPTTLVDELLPMLPGKPRRLHVVLPPPRQGGPRRRRTRARTVRRRCQVRWLAVARWQALGPDAELMDRVNPVYIPAITWSRRR